MKHGIIVFLMFLSTAIFAQNFEWTEQNSGVSTNLRDVFFIDNQNGWAVGIDGVIINTSDGGQTWTSQTSGTTERLNAIFFIDADHGWCAGGTSNQALLRTIDGGTTWEDITSSDITNINLGDIAFADTNTGWVISMFNIYITHDGGTSWTEESYIDGVDGVSHQAIAVTSDTTAYIASRSGVGTNAQADVYNRRPFDAPNSWGPSLLSDFNKGDFLYSIAFSNDSIGFAGGAYGHIYKLEQEDEFNLGGPWVVNFDISSTGADFINLISFPSERVGMFKASIDLPDGSAALIYHTSDGGDTWSSSPDTIRLPLSQGLHAPDTNNAWIVGSAGRIFKGEPANDPPNAINQLGLDKDVSIYPNPANSMVNVKINSNNNELINYTLSDMTGRVIEQGVWNSNSSNSSFTLNISEVTKGAYLLTLSTKDGLGSYPILIE